MLVPALTLAAALSLSLGTDAVPVAGTLLAPGAPQPRPQFTLGAGDALGARIRVNDIILARRLEGERTQFATVPTQD